MKDLAGRNIDYMRISLTDRCNFRCKYCMPDGVESVPMSELLTYEEILKVCQIATGLGIRKIKLTGGEPLVRKDLTTLVGMIKNQSSIEEVTMTTNGSLLEEHIDLLKENGLDAVNVSLDTLRPEIFEKITGRNELSSVIAGIKAAISRGMKVKINTVLRPELSDEEIIELINFSNENGVHIRFIELMPIGQGRLLSWRSNAEIISLLERVYGPLEEDVISHGNGPARYYKVKGIDISVGMISAMHGKFCQNCNRIRMTSRGQLKSCLCYASAIDLREPLREERYDKVELNIKQAILNKPREHCFESIGEISESQRMSAIGG